MYSQGIALILASFPFLGLFGADKFYLGLTAQGFIMTLLTMTFVGCLVTVPWSFLCSLFLVISILWGKTPMFYPSDIKWDPLTNVDKIIAWIVLGLWLIGFISGSFSYTIINKTRDESTNPTPTIPNPTPTSPNPTPTTPGV